MTAPATMIAKRILSNTNDVDSRYSQLPITALTMPAVRLQRPDGAYQGWPRRLIKTWFRLHVEP
jgi:hypothetical protein